MHILVLTVASLVIGGILLDHAIQHKGIFFQESDFYRAIVNTVNSHEGWIFLIIIFVLGMLTMEIIS